MLHVPTPAQISIITDTTNSVILDGLSRSDWYTFATAVVGIWCTTMIFVISPKQRDIWSAAVSFIFGLLVLLYAFIADYCQKHNTSISDWVFYWNPVILQIAPIAAWCLGACLFVLARRRYVKLESDLKKDNDKRASEADLRVQQAEKKLAEEMLLLDKTHAEDRVWSENPFQFIEIMPHLCAINLSLQTISLRVKIINKYKKSRRIWISTNIAIYGSDQNTTLCTVPLPLITAEIPANSIIEVNPQWPAVILTGHIGAIRTVYEHHHKLRVQFLGASMTTLVNLTGGEAKAIEGSIPGLAPSVLAEVYD